MEYVYEIEFIREVEDLQYEDQLCPGHFTVGIAKSLEAAKSYIRNRVPLEKLDGELEFELAYDDASGREVWVSNWWPLYPDDPDIVCEYYRIKRQWLIE